MRPFEMGGGRIFYSVRLNRIVLLLSVLSLSLGLDAQWNSIGDSLVLPTFMLGGNYAPGVSAVDVDVDGDGIMDVTASDLDFDGNPDLITADLDGDGKFDTTITDINDDGFFDKVDFGRTNAKF